MTRDHDAELAEQVAMTMRADRLLDAILDGRAWTLQDELVFLLDGPFGVDWRTGRDPQHRPHRRPGSRSSWSSARPWPWPSTWTRCGPTTRPTSPRR
jgi:hypothetical protein